MPATITQSPVSQIPGYDYGGAGSAHSPVTLEELRHIEETVGWTDYDALTLRNHDAIFDEHAEEMVGAWRKVIASQLHLAKWFTGGDGQPDEAYKARVKQRFVQWVRDAVIRPHDQAWLDYQEEIGLRHTPAKKNKTDHTATANVVPLRYLIAFGTTITRLSRKFFVDAGVSGDELVILEDAWAKAVQLHITLWTRPYAKEGYW